MVNNIDLFYAGHGPVIGKIFVNNPDKKIVDNDNVSTIIILDISGSMASYVNVIVNNYLPNALKKADLGDQPISVITFADKHLSKLYRCTADTLSKQGICTQGSTYMSGAIDLLQSELLRLKHNNVRIMAISDGDLHDQSETVTKATNLAQSVSGKYNIRSNAIRLFTSSQQPDTKGLASVLQLDSGGKSKLIDFRCSMDADFINLFSDVLTDDLTESVKMKASKPIFMSNPWSAPSNEINLSYGENTFWVLPDDSTSITINDELIGFNESRTMTFENFESVLKSKIEYFIKRLKVLKVVDMATSRTEVEHIKKYFNSIQTMFEVTDASETLEMDNTLSARIQYFKKRHLRESKALLQEISVIANQDHVSKLNSLQQADYLRSVATSSNTINLAKRGLKQGMDFDNEAIKEVKNMAAHLNEINHIDDSSHAVSFYSQETTLGGIKELCGLVPDGSIDQMSALEILHILNIVGVPCDAVVGDFPDPKTYHINKFLFGDYISISDILTVKQLGQEIKDPFSHVPIKNAIPFFDDDRIQQFLIKYAPTLLEYTASLGMRGMIINVPSTYKYTIVDGLWTMIRLVQDSPTDVNVDLFVKFVHTYKTAVGTQFDYVLDLIKPMSTEDKANNLSLYIGNNGVTNMLGPLIALHEHPDKMSLMPDILRALYTFEYYQVLKKYYRSDSDGYIKRKQFLNDLIGIDFSKYASKLPPMFEEQPIPNHHDECHTNKEMFDSVNKSAYWIDYLCLAPKMIGLALKNDNAFLKTMDYNKSNYENELEIGFDLDKFKLYCMVQGMMFDTLASRYDSELDKMKIEDAGNEERLDAFLADYIRQQYDQHYKAELEKQHVKEVEVLTDELINKIVGSTTIDEYITLFKNGLARNYVSVAITDVFKPGFDKLKEQLFSNSIAYPLKAAKLRILALGCDEYGNIVYNKGNTLGMNPFKLESIFKNLGFDHVWESIKDKYIDKNVHLYRAPDIANHRGHSNSKPSFGAYGFKNLREFQANVSVAEFEEYCKVHTHCCGIWDGKPAKWA
jgi:hypothetical protein